MTENKQKKKGTLGKLMEYAGMRKLQSENAGWRI